MKQLSLSETTTKDGLVHQGIFCRPEKPGKKAILWIHGLTSNFYSNPKRIDAVMTACVKNGIGFASFNNRGHDMFASAHRINPESESGYSYTTVGSGNEHFEECIYDIDAGIDFLVREGFAEIILVGSSTGANKACHYCSMKYNKNLKGIVLLSPISDRLTAKVPWYLILFLKVLAVFGRGEKILSVGSYFPGTPNRFLSLITPKSAEDIFDYGDPEPCMERFSKTTLPLLVIFGGSDTLADRSMEEIKRQFDTHQKSSHYASYMLPCANHGFDGKEKEVVGVIINWIKAV
jgi:dienelactone hydrolase